MTRVICSPCGGLMNHVRWLLLLSPEFVWDTTNKVRYITNIVYPKRRSPFVWLSHEYMFREVTYFKKLITVTHSIHEFSSPSKILALTVDPELSFTHYLKFNPELNGLVNQATNDPSISIEDIKKSYMLSIEVENDRNILRSTTTDDILALNIDNLYTNRDLDLDFYNKAVDYFGISNRYEDANHIHNLWFDLQRDNETMMHLLSSNAVDVESYWRLSTNKPMTQAEYDIALELIRNTYGE